MEAVKRVGAALTEAGITWALGGSCVLIAHGLRQEAPSDWDVTVDEEPDRVRAALARIAQADRTGSPTMGGAHDLGSSADSPVGLAITANPQTGDGFYATTARLAIEPAIDLMVRFAIRTESGIVHLPTIVSRTWEGMPVGSPEVWAVAYRLMRRPVKPDLLSGWLRENGADPTIKAALLAQPLPGALRAEVESWPDRRG
ncbi:MAG TPA: hypothetical protein VK191_13420 [Symbiobacteriaceae bacterium]|nr:hypothetical protein [Symbiobacteriaceae bacterium]